ncbi:MAG: alpha/beta fold hydrolase [Candidatus Limnocylindrales bacterium]
MSGLSPGVSGRPEELPPEVTRELEGPTPGVRRRVLVGELEMSVLNWGRLGDPPVLLVHGARGAARIWWRVGPALAATGRYVVAPDLPGHGETPVALSVAPFRETAGLLARLLSTLGISTDGLAVVGTSWGALVTSRLPELGIVPRPLVLIEPPVIERPLAQRLNAAFRSQPEGALPAGIEFPRAPVDESWPPGEREVAEEAAAAADPRMLRALFEANTEWDGGLAALEQPEASDLDLWLIRGDPRLGGLTPDQYLARLRQRWPADHLISIAGAGHVPHRSQTVETTRVLLRALSAGEALT